MDIEHKNGRIIARLSDEERFVTRVSAPGSPRVRVDTIDLSREGAGIKGSCRSFFRFSDKLRMGEFSLAGIQQYEGAIAPELYTTLSGLEKRLVSQPQEIDE